MPCKKDTICLFLRICSNLLQKPDPPSASIYTAKSFHSLDLQPTNNCTNKHKTHHCSNIHDHVITFSILGKSCTSGLNRDMDRLTRQSLTLQHPTQRSTDSHLHHHDRQHSLQNHDDPIWSPTNTPTKHSHIWSKGERGLTVKLKLLFCLGSMLRSTCCLSSSHMTKWCACEPLCPYWCLHKVKNWVLKQKTEICQTFYYYYITICCCCMFFY